MNRFVPLLAAALLFAPLTAKAQYDGVVAPQSGDAASSTAGNNGFSGDTGGYDQQFQKQGTPNNIYEFVNKPDTRTDLKKAQAETEKRRDAMVKRMQANSARILEQQKERAWKIANPGKPYPGNGNPDDGNGFDDQTTADDGTGDTAGTGDDGSGDEADGDCEGGGDGFSADTGFDSGDVPESGQE